MKRFGNLVLHVLYRLVNYINDGYNPMIIQNRVYLIDCVACSPLLSFIQPFIQEGLQVFFHQYIIYDKLLNITTFLSIVFLNQQSMIELRIIWQLCRQRGTPKGQAVMILIEKKGQKGFLENYTNREKRTRKGLCKLY